jgi:type IV pilus assembly protein PilN
MIRINLLPVRELQAEVMRRREITIGAVVLGAVTLLLLGTYFYRSYELTLLEKQLAELRAEMLALNARVKQVGDLQNRIKEFDSKHKVIADLNKKKTGPVGVMESLSNATPTRLWLTEFKEVGSKLTMSGFAADNQTVADFLKALAATAYFRDVELVETAQGAQDAGTFKRFSIRTTVFYLPQGALPGAAGGALGPTEEKKS